MEIEWFGAPRRTLLWKHFCARLINGTSSLPALPPWKYDEPQPSNELMKFIHHFSKTANEDKSVVMHQKSCHQNNQTPPTWFDRFQILKFFFFCFLFFFVCLFVRPSASVHFLISVWRIGDGLQRKTQIVLKQPSCLSSVSVRSPSWSEFSELLSRFRRVL